MEPKTSGTPTSDVTPDSDVSSNGLDGLRVPQHVAIIMDGNARWAKLRGLSIAQGHRAGYNNIERVARSLGDRGVKEVTLFAFSTENWHRPEEEVQALMELAAEAIEQGVMRFHENGIRLRHVGHGRRLPSAMLRKIAEAERLTQNKRGDWVEFGLRLWWARRDRERDPAHDQ